MVLKDYLLMIRLPNLFTIPSNIIVGYVTLQGFPNNGLSISLPLIIFSSCLIYTAGIIFNDYSDIETDRREKRLRPLASGSVAKRPAVILGLSCLVLALVISGIVGPLTLLLSSIIIFIALFYDFKLKQTKIGSIMMGSARASNIVYGASPILIGGIFESVQIQRLAIESACVFIYVVAIMLVSAREAGVAQSNPKWLFVPFLMISVVVTVMITSVILGKFKADLLGNLVILIFIICFAVSKLTRRHKLEISSEQIQNLVKILVLCMVILDSSFVSGVSGLFFGTIVALFIVPGIILSRILYVT
ncbi:MAG TPA: UbiA family prenyltransferase [Nitrososphaeraceae archaeon]